MCVYAAEMSRLANRADQHLHIAGADIPFLLLSVLGCQAGYHAAHRCVTNVLMHSLCPTRAFPAPARFSTSLFGTGGTCRVVVKDDDRRRARAPHRTPDEISNAGLPMRSLIHQESGHGAVFRLR